MAPTRETRAGEMQPAKPPGWLFELFKVSLIPLICSVGGLFVIGYEVKDNAERIREETIRIDVLTANMAVYSTRIAICEKILADREVLVRKADEFAKGLSDIEAKVGRLPSEVPPQWFISKVNRIEQDGNLRDAAQDERIRSIENRIIEIQGKLDRGK